MHYGGSVMKKKLLAACVSVSLMVSLFTAFPYREYSGTSAQAASEKLLAFPYAEGYGKYTTGGRGGEVYHVTNLNATGSGSLYYGMTSRNTDSGGKVIPRTIVFDVCGYIKFPSSKITGVTDLTIAGQTAPGEGITLYNHIFHLSGANNVIIRYLHFRRGNLSGKDDSAYFQNSKNLIIDHCSFEWGNDENCSIKDCSNVTLQWSIIAQSLKDHSMGGLVEGNTATIHHCLYAHNNDRNVKTNSTLDFTNNVVYNWGSWAYVAGGPSSGTSDANIVGNYFIAGANTNPRNATLNFGVSRGNNRYSMFADNNFIDSDKDGVLNGVERAGRYTGTDCGASGADIVSGWLSSDSSDPSYAGATFATDYNTSTRTSDPSRLPADERYCTTIMSDPYDRGDYDVLSNAEPAGSAYRRVLLGAGASLMRDAADEYVIASVENQTGYLITDPSEVGGYLDVKSGDSKVGTAADANRDGINDAWARENMPAGAGYNDTAPSGYTWLEEYLNELAAPTFPVIDEETLAKPAKVSLTLPEQVKIPSQTVISAEVRNIAGDILDDAALTYSVTDANSGREVSGISAADGVLAVDADVKSCQVIVKVTADNNVSAQKLVTIGEPYGRLEIKESEAAIPSQTRLTPMLYDIFGNRIAAPAIKWSGTDKNGVDLSKSLSQIRLTDDGVLIVPKNAPAQRITVVAVTDSGEDPVSARKIITVGGAPADSEDGQIVFYDGFDNPALSAGTEFINSRANFNGWTVSGGSEFAGVYVSAENVSGYDGKKRFAEFSNTAPDPDIGTDYIGEMYKIEAESTTDYHKMTIDDGETCSGGKAAYAQGDVMSYLRYSFNAEEAGTYKLIIYYLANTRSRDVSVHVNGDYITTTEKTTTDKAAEGTVLPFEEISVRLNKGENIISLDKRIEENDVGACASIDYFTLQQITEMYKIEAESTTDYKKMTIDDGEVCSGGKAAYPQGSVASYLRYSFDAPASGTYLMKVYYLANARGRDVSVHVNGEYITTTEKTSSAAADDGTVLAFDDILIPLDKGINIISLDKGQKDGDGGACATIDYFTLYRCNEKKNGAAKLAVDLTAANVTGKANVSFDVKPVEGSIAFSGKDGDKTIYSLTCRDGVMMCGDTVLNSSLTGWKDITVELDFAAKTFNIDAGGTRTENIAFTDSAASALTEFSVSADSPVSSARVGIDELKITRLYKNRLNNIVLSASGKPADRLVSGGRVESVSVTKTEDGEARIIGGLYNGDGLLIKAFISDKITQTGSFSVTPLWTLPENSENYVLKLFMWSDTEIMRPMSDNIEQG